MNPVDFVNLTGAHLREIPRRSDGTSTQASSTAYQHGTFIAGIISGRREAGARVINSSLGLVQPSTREERSLKAALQHAVRRDVIPVVAYDRQGRPLDQSNSGSSSGRRGLGALGERITSLGATDKGEMNWIHAFTFVPSKEVHHEHAGIHRRDLGLRDGRSLSDDRRC